MPHSLPPNPYAVGPVTVPHPSGAGLWTRLPLARRRGAPGQYLEHKGSKARCHLLTHGQPHEVAARLNELIQGHGVMAPDNFWMPKGFDEVDEADLLQQTGLVTPSQRDALHGWWLSSAKLERTLCWDIAGKCLVGGKPGLLLIEAKAREGELDHTPARRRLAKRGSPESMANSAHIMGAIAAAGQGLTQATGHDFRRLLDAPYQMANRFAWSWKLASLGIPVILVYLGLLDAQEMPVPITTDARWTSVVKSHGHPAIPDAVWNLSQSVGGVPLVPLIRTFHQPFATPLP